ncbi:MAG: HEAT repeat domain-containing protein [bacterium]
MRKILCLLVFYGFASAQPELQKKFELLESTSIAVRREAVMQIGQMRSPTAMTRLSEVLENDTDFGVRAQAAEALGNIRNKASTPALIKALGDENKNVKSSVIIALGYMRDRNAVDPLLSFLGKEKDTGLKISAINVLGVIGDERALPTFAKLLKDENPRIKTISAQALGRLRNPAAVEPLLESSKDETRNVRLYSVRALGEIGDKSAVKGLEKLLKTEKDDNVKIAISHSLGRLGSAVGFSVALSAASSSDMASKKDGIRALGVIGKVTPEVEKIIIEAWESPDRGLKRDAEMAASYLKIKLPEPAQEKETKKENK